jgi:Domain of unknown function (DUF6268)
MHLWRRKSLDHLAEPKKVNILPLGRLLQFTAIFFAALGFVGRNSCGTDALHFQESVETETAKQPGDCQPPTTINPFDTELSTTAESHFEIRPESQSIVQGAMSAEKLRSLMRPRVAWSSEWLTSSDIDLSRYDIRFTVPTYPFFGPPPPMISTGFSYTDLIGAETFGLPDDLFEYSVGVSWVRPIKDRWIVRSMLGVALATDNENLGSGAWQFRGGIFAVYEPNENWQWVLGAIAIGRNDLPAVPAIGVIYTPRRDVKIDLTLPKPRIQKLFADIESRQQWVYVGLALGGSTWAFERADQTDDQLTYGDWRVVAGLELLPSPVAGERFTVGRTLGFELGYVFSRDLEFSSGLPNVSLSNAMTLGITARF